MVRFQRPGKEKPLGGWRALLRFQRLQNAEKMLDFRPSQSEKDFSEHFMLSVETMEEPCSRNSDHALGLKANP